MTPLDDASRNPLSSASPIEPVPVSAKGFNWACEEVRRLQRTAWCRVRVYRDFERDDRAQGKEIEARRWRRYRVETLRDIRMLREHVR